MKIGQYCQQQGCRHVDLEQFWQAFASRGFVSDSWAFLFLIKTPWSNKFIAPCRNTKNDAILSYISRQRHLASDNDSKIAFSLAHTCLTPHSRWTPCDINVTYTSLKSAFNGLQFHYWQYGSIFIRLAVIASETREMSRNSKRILIEFDLTAVQGHPSSSILVSMESPYVTSY